jgi:hypothetical protein
VAADRSRSVEYCGADPDYCAHTAADMDADGGADVSTGGNASARYAGAVTYAACFTHAD